MLTARFHDSLDDIDATTWDGLIPDANPFVRHAFLDGLERTGCIRREWGWMPHHLTLHDGDRLVAVAPLYLKGNSHGEYVFDWGWAGAWERAGGDYYPKLLNAVPYSPVTGPRLLVGHDTHAHERRVALVTAMHDEARRLGLSSVHANFLTERDADAFGEPWLSRFDWQYHWHNRDYRDFDDFLAALRHKKRKNIRRERAQVATSNLECRVQHGNELTDDEWRQVHALYRHTFDSKGNQATLTSAFFRHLARTLGDAVVLALARRDGDIVAMALFVRGDDTLYGRYWGAREHVPSLHFELCYYRGIDYAITHALARFEPGAQGQHKLARGFVPVRTRSRHYLAHPAFREAVAASLFDEAAALDAWGRELKSHSPYSAAGRRA
ncbi:MAG TPA: GNAT family N-acetyltransferase [Oleiagrimonas sp.]|nr:GNAT family N-acetyltransferase [Oleiagrimonas sp.]